MLSKEYLLQLGESALLAGLIAIDPIINALDGQALDWKLIAIPFVFAVAHSLTKHIKNEPQRTGIDTLLNTTEQLLPSKLTTQHHAVRKTEI